ncbi:phosphopantetheine adenylyltransferase 1-like, partial [Agrilus planipennis]|uniref:Phosphopantetheine adenylyltransferase 1-like n=1 Tax=Agrilus planipennis TaxID=224129 RepID=A0A7F5RII1_AGRPL
NLSFQAAKHCQNLDVRVLLSGLKYKNKLIYTEREVELVIFDEKYASDEVQKFLSTKLVNISKDYKILTCANIAAEPISADLEQKNDKVYQHTVLGGTFDRLHLAHKLLLSEAALRSNSKITVGVTEENMIKSKILWELIEPLETRMSTVENFLKDICPELNISVVSIEDPFGPTQHDPTIDLLVVSKETIRGGEKVNEVRKSKGLPLLDLVAVDLIDEPAQNPHEEKKISSNTQRMRLLGTLLKPVKQNLNLPKRPYVIGLTGKFIYRNFSNTVELAYNE